MNVVLCKPCNEISKCLRISNNVDNNNVFKSLTVILYYEILRKYIVY